jgi:superfamily II DNA or RNA helicase
MNNNGNGQLADYHKFLNSKQKLAASVGFEPKLNSPWPKPFQRDLIEWFCRLGRGACFAGTGLGKTLMQLLWAEQVILHDGGKVLILAPLAVANQTKRESEKFGIGVDVTVCRSQSDVQSGINITNYDRIHKFDPSVFSAIVPDESSILKHIGSKTRQQITDAFARTKYKLPCTATPAPNDQMELGNHSEFCGWMTRSEMLATYFVHDGGRTSNWRLRGHAEDDFYKWLASWSAMIRAPSDLGYEDGEFTLPPLRFHEHEIQTGPMAGMLFPMEAKTLSDQRLVRKDSIDNRVGVLAEMVNASDEPWLIWCNLNKESTEATKSIGDAIEVCGSQDNDEKEEKLDAFCQQKARVLVTKPAIAGFGLNLQHCHNMAFLGLSHSYEAMYQAVRRCWRFGQKHPVDVHIIVTDRDAAILSNIHRKEQEHQKMLDGMVAAMVDTMRENVRSGSRYSTEYKATKSIKIPSWLKTQEV